MGLALISELRRLVIIGMCVSIFALVLAILCDLRISG